MNQAPSLPQVSTDSLLGEIADDFLARLDRGERPDVEAFAREHPEQSLLIRDVFPALAAMRECSPAAFAGPPTARAAHTTHALGDYRIVRELGRGGMGIVYEAEQLSLGRRVALKVLPFAAALDPKQLQRFKNEAQAAAHLHHANIVPVHGVGCERGVHYYAMQLIEGQTLAAMIKELRSAEQGVPSALNEVGPYEATRSCPPDLAVPNGKPHVAAESTIKAALSTEHSTRQPAWFRTAANMGVQAAEALDHAHGEGVVHRDIKPANLLIDGKGNLWITDFGLAQLQSDAGLTLTGDLVGTIRYMSPEQALAKRVIVDHRTDIYSLGVTLYELLTLEPAFDGRDRQELLRQIAFDEPRALRQHNKAIPAELETIVLKAIAKNPAERYATAQDLADDLQRFLKDEPIRAKRPSLLARARKWSRRHRPVVASAIVAALAVVAIAIIALVISLGNISGALKEKTAALAEKSEALAKESAALERERETTYLQETVLAGRELAAGNVGRAEELLNHCPDRLRGWEWHFLKRQRYEMRDPIKHDATVIKVAFSPNGQQIASVDMDGAFEIRDAETGHVLHTLDRQALPNRARLVRGLAYSPDSRYLALARHDGSVRLWNATDGQPLQSLEGHKGPVWQVAFSPDNRTLISGGSDGTVRLWDVVSGKELRKFEGHPAPVKGVAFRPDDRSVVAACDDGTVKVWDREAGREMFSFRGELANPWVAQFSPDTRRLGWACMDGVVKVWDTTTGTLEIDKQSNMHQCRAIVFHPDGKRIALAGFDGTLRLLDATSGREMFTIFAHTNPVADAAFSSDGNKLVSGSYDHTMRIWDATRMPDGGPTTAQCVTLETGHNEAVSGVDFSPNGRWLASSSWDGTVRVWECSASRDEPEARHAERDGYLLRYTLRGHSSRVIGVVFSSDNRTLASGSWDKTVKLWDLQAPVGDSLAALRTIPTKERVASVAFSPDGRLLAVGQGTGLALYDPATGTEAANFKPTPAPVPAVAFDPVSGRLASAGASDPAIRVWDVSSDKPLFEIRNYANSNSSVAFSPDGKLIASQGRRGETPGEPTITVWDVETREVRHFTGHSHYIWKVVFSPDGQYLASGSWDSTIKIWDLKDASVEPVTLRGHAGTVHGLAFNHDGSRLASGSGYAGNGEVKIWDAALWRK